MKDFRSLLRQSDPEIYGELLGEEGRQQRGIELIPSENYTYPEVLAVLGSVLTNKYSEGYPGRRYYGGQEHTDAIERLACARACRLFSAEHANVQPLSGSPMNQSVYFGLLKQGATVLAMDLSHGGHLTHGAPVSHMSKVFNFVRYRTEPDGSLDYDAILRHAKEVRPAMILAGFSSYPREYDYHSFRAIANEVGALAMADVSHIGGLIAGGALKNPFEAGFDVVTTTTHKTLRGPRGGLILCRNDLARQLDSAVFPGLQGGPHMNNIAGAAITFDKAAQPDFRDYARQVLRNARALADVLIAEGVGLVTGGTDNHLLVFNSVASFGLDGQQAQEILDRARITANKQVIPDDPRPPMRPSGIRLGTPACTTRGMTETDMRHIAEWIVKALRHPQDESMIEQIGREVTELCREYPVPGVLDEERYLAK